MQTTDTLRLRLVRRILGPSAISDSLQFCQQSAPMHAHSLYQRRKQLSQRVEPAMQRRAPQPHALALVDVFQPIVWQVVIEAARGNIRQQSRSYACT